jgi:protoporphyrinogen/coproporphyrinogen III oxidase
VIKGGTQVLIDALACKLQPEQCLEGRVQRLVWDSASASFFIETQDSEFSIGAREVFVCTAGRSTAAFIEPLSEPLAERLSRFAYASILVSHFSVARSAPIPPETFGVLFPPSSESSLMGAMFTSEVFPCVAPSDRHLVTCFSQLGASHSPSDNQQAAELLTKELESKFGIKEAHLLQQISWPYAIPQYELGHYQLMDEMAELEKKFPGLHFVGNDHGGIGVPDRVAAGGRALGEGVFVS